MLKDSDFLESYPHFLFSMEMERQVRGHDRLSSKKYLIYSPPILLMVPEIGSHYGTRRHLAQILGFSSESAKQSLYYRENTRVKEIETASRIALSGDSIRKSRLHIHVV